MQRCRNCGQTAVRTEDWACQWCGYPLLSKSHKKIPKTYKRLKEEKLSKQKPPVREETEASLLPNHGTLPPTHTLKSEAELLPEPDLTLAAIEVTAEELLSAHEIDGVAAGAKFAKRILKVTGVVNRIEVNKALDIHEIKLTTAEKKRLQSIRCMFDKEHRPKLSRLTIGQTVTVQGKYEGYIRNILMSDCVLVGENASSYNATFPLSFG